MQQSETGPVDKLPWTQDRVDELRRLWIEGLSASHIARILGAGVTRNAVIGKLHRLGMSGRVTPARASSSRPRRQREPSHPGRPSTLPTIGATALKPQMEPEIDTQPEPEPIRLLDLSKGERVTILMLSDKTCRWPMGDPGTEDFHFCGLSPKPGQPYCPHHARAAYQPLHDRRRLKHA